MGDEKAEDSIAHLLFVFIIGIGSPCAALAGLELTTEIKLALNSQRTAGLCLHNLSAEIKDL